MAGLFCRQNEEKIFSGAIFIHLFVMNLVPVLIIPADDLANSTLQKYLDGLPRHGISVSDVRRRISVHQVIQHRHLAGRELALIDQPFQIDVYTDDRLTEQGNSSRCENASVRPVRIERGIEPGSLCDLLAHNPFLAQRHIVPLTKATSFVSRLDLHRAHSLTSVLIIKNGNLLRAGIRVLFCKSPCPLEIFIVERVPL